jgi:hypothetical protein
LGVHFVVDCPVGSFVSLSILESMTFKEGDAIDVVAGVHKQRRGYFVKYCGNRSCVVLLSGDLDMRTVRLASIVVGNESESEKGDDVLISRQEYQSLLQDVQRLTEALQKLGIRKEGKKKS